MMMAKFVLIFSYKNCSFIIVVPVIALAFDYGNFSAKLSYGLLKFTFAGSCLCSRISYSPIHRVVEGNSYRKLLSNSSSRECWFQIFVLTE